MDFKDHLGPTSITMGRDISYRQNTMLLKQCLCKTQEEFLFSLMRTGLSDSDFTPMTTPFRGFRKEG